jgi:hypothetical protein
MICRAGGPERMVVRITAVSVPCRRGNRRDHASRSTRDNACCSRVLVEAARVRHRRKAPARREGRRLSWSSLSSGALRERHMYAILLRRRGVLRNASVRSAAERPKTWRLGAANERDGKQNSDGDDDRLHAHGSLLGCFGVPVGDQVFQLCQAVRTRSRLMITRTGKPGRMVRVG